MSSPASILCRLALQCVLNMLGMAYLLACYMLETPIAWLPVFLVLGGAACVAPPLREVREVIRNIKAYTEAMHDT